MPMALLEGTPSEDLQHSATAPCPLPTKASLLWTLASICLSTHAGSTMRGREFSLMVKARPDGQQPKTSYPGHT